MRRVLNQATSDWQTVAALATAPTRSEREATRRACKRLVEQGRLESNYVNRDDTSSLWSDVCAERGYAPGARPAHPGWMFAVRRTTPEHAAAHGQVA